MCVQWAKGALPADPKKLARLADCRRKAIGVVIQRFTKGNGGLLRNPRLEQVRGEQEAYRDKQAANARRGWDARLGIAKPMPTHMPERCSSSSPSLSDKDLMSAPDGANLRNAARKPAIRARNPLLDALASVDGSDLAQVTGSAWGAIAKALAEIKVVSPDVTPAEIERHAARYRQIHRDWTLTPTALAKHWASLATPQTAEPTAPPKVVEPAAWQSALGQDDEDVRLFGRNQWSAIPQFYRQRIASKFARTQPPTSGGNQ